jgi:DNA adenine methylase
MDAEHREYIRIRKSASLEEKEIKQLTNKFNKLFRNIKQITTPYIAKPLLKWIGSKNQIITTIMNKFPHEINNYHELFLGGGSVLLALLSYQKNNIIKINGNIYAYDINETLINFFINVQKHPLKLFEKISELNQQTNKESYYYYIRNRYNKLTNMNSIESSALFLFLNKTCFRGIFRTSKNGFNVPYGNYNNPIIINKTHLLEISELIQNVIFKHCDFKDSIKFIKENDFVYLDPPYFNTYNNYTNNKFYQHNTLFDICKRSDFYFLMNNSDVVFVRESFKNYYIKTLYDCKRKINSKNPNSIVNELLISNYDNTITTTTRLTT